MNGNVNKSSPIIAALPADHVIAMRFRDIYADSYSSVPDPDLTTVVHDVHGASTVFLLVTLSPL